MTVERGRKHNLQNSFTNAKHIIKHQNKYLPFHIQNNIRSLTFLQINNAKIKKVEGEA